MSFPLRASIEITRNCNLGCVMCPHSRLPKYATWDPARDMSAGLFERVVTELLPHVEEAQLQGLGETTVAPRWPAFLERLTRRDGRARLKLVTNATRLDDRLWERTVAAGIAIGASIDGATPESYAAVRVGGRLEPVRRNLELLGRLGADLTLMVTVQRANLRELPAFVELAARVGARRVELTRVVSGLRRGPLRTLRQLLRPAPGLDGLPESLIVERRDAAVERGRALGVEVALMDSLLDAPPPRRWECVKPWTYLVVRHDGDIGLCNHLIGDEHWESMGNLADCGFEEIWDGPAFRRARQEHAAGRPLNEACGWCYARRLAD